MITKKKCENKKCKKKFLGTAKARFCCDNCRIVVWRKTKKEKKENG